MKAEELLKRIAQGDKFAFEKLYNAYVKLVYATAYAVTRSASDAEDVTADTFLIVWKKAGSYNGGSATAWMSTIAKNRALTLIKKRGREQVAEDDFVFERQSSSDHIEQKVDLEKALKQLDEKERQTVLWHHAGYKHREIAEMTGEPIGTVTWRYNIALKKLKEILQGEE